MSITIYRKSDNKPITCERAQFDLMTKGKNAKYSLKPVKIAEPLAGKGQDKKPE